jgi:hypothetical protein
VWYADDATGCDKFKDLRAWYDRLLIAGPIYGYFPKPSKCILITKPDKVAEARRFFDDTKIEVATDGSKDKGVEVNTEGTRHLGAAVGTNEFKNIFVQKKVDGWISSIRQLAEISRSEQAAFPPSLIVCKVSGPSFLAPCQTLALSSNSLKM